MGREFDAGTPSRIRASASPDTHTGVGTTSNPLTDLFESAFSPDGRAAGFRVTYPGGVLPRHIPGRRRWLVAERDPVVALVNLDPEIEEFLREILDMEGYVARAYTLDAEGAGLGHELPDLIVLRADRAGRSLTLLDAWREDEAMGTIPVVILGALEHLKEQAQASGNVHATLGMPFDLTDLLQAFQDALNHRPFEERIRTVAVSDNPVFLQAADVLTRAQRHLMLDWVQHIRLVSPFSERPDLSVRDFLNSLPRLMNAYIAILRHGVPAAKSLEEDPDVVERIRHHTETRRAQGIPAAGVISEYQVLRDVVTARLQRELDANGSQPVVGVITRLFDDAQRITVARYDELNVSATGRL
jgi:hypothetical protein